MKSHTAPIFGCARSYASYKPIRNGLVTALEKNLKLYTDSNGNFGPFEWPIGEPMTLVFEKAGSFYSGYKTTQTATLIVPPEGINNISFQVPSNMIYKFFSFAMGIAEDPNACQIVATITPPNTTPDDIPQGVAGVKATLSPSNIKPFYFDMFPITYQTNPCSRNLERTSRDGGAGFFNVPEGEYTFGAEKDDIPFSSVRVKARKGILVNLSPPHGPKMLIEPKPTEKEKKQNHFNFFKPALAVGFAAIGLATLGPCAGIAGVTLGYVMPEITEKLKSNCTRKR